MFFKEPLKCQIVCNLIFKLFYIYGTSNKSYLIIRLLFHILFQKKISNPAIILVIKVYKY